MESYGCCQCQTRHYKDEQVYREHLLHQSKHGISRDYQQPEKTGGKQING